MEKIRIYTTNRLSLLVLTTLNIAFIISASNGNFTSFYKYPLILLGVVFFLLVLPPPLFFGFTLKILEEKVLYTHLFIFKKVFKTKEISHIFYREVWIPGKGENTGTFYIVRPGGGWRNTISLTNSAFREKDLAEIATRLKRINPRIKLDEESKRLVEKYEEKSFVAWNVSSGNVTRVMRR